MFTENGIDRCYYELCALSELSWGLKSGDVWVRGSRRHCKFDQYLMEPGVWAQRKEKLLAQAGPLLDSTAYLQGRMELLDQQLQSSRPSTS